MVLTKKIFIILIIFFTSSTFGKGFSIDNILNLISEKKYIKVIELVDQSLKNQSINPNTFSSDTEYNKITQIKLFLKLESMLLAIRASQLEMTMARLEKMQQILEISDDFDLDADKYDFDRLREVFESESESWKESRFTFNYFASISYFTWNYALSLTDSTGENATLYSKERGPCFGGGIRYQNAMWGIESGLCYGYVSATVGEDSTNVKYNQSKVPVDAFISTTSLIWRPKDRVAIKIGMPIIYHSGDYKPPVGGSISDTNQISYGYLIANEWSFRNMAFEISYGDIKNYPSSFWSFKLIFNL
tara:strand:- start:2985 stop:3896 length:912 start_codon:yes stop_codon:yes gene_type:complete